jgi:hypothetical protein
MGEVKEDEGDGNRKLGDSNKRRKKKGRWCAILGSLRKPQTACFASTL